MSPTVSQILGLSEAKPGGARDFLRKLHSLAVQDAHPATGQSPCGECGANLEERGSVMRRYTHISQRPVSYEYEVTGRYIGQNFKADPGQRAYTKKYCVSFPDTCTNCGLYT